MILLILWDSENKSDFLRWYFFDQNPIDVAGAKFGGEKFFVVRNLCLDYRFPLNFIWSSSSLVFGVAEIGTALLAGELS